MGDNTYDNGSQLELTCSSEGGLDLAYNWSRMMNDFDNETATGIDTNNLTIDNVATVDGGDYTCTVTNDAGTSNYTITVYGEALCYYLHSPVVVLWYIIHHLNL